MYLINIDIKQIIFEFSKVEKIFGNILQPKSTMFI